MKKYIVFSFIFTFIFSFNLNLVGATVASNDAFYLPPGCVQGDMYSRTTGERCTLVTNACEEGDLYNSVTGEACKRTEPKFACIGSYNSGLKVGSRGTEVFALQQILKEKGLFSGKVDGIYGPITDGARKNYDKKCPVPSSNSVVISGVSGPQTLKVGETGTWKVSAYNKNGGNLTYEVLWGDEELGPQNAPMASSPSSTSNQSATFSHSYYHAGNFEPTFTVTSKNTINCVTTPCPSNGGSATTSLSVKVGNTTETSSIKVLSPNGGESWNKGTTQTIKWKDNTPLPKCSSSSVAPCLVAAPLYNIKLINYNECTANGGYTCTAWYSSDRIIAKNVPGSSYSWTIPNCSSAYDYEVECVANFDEIPAGSYKVQVCHGNDICDLSDSKFYISPMNIIN
jgi:peptidoglycan hydrolase-like protein with peptidoglycan-binding domain